MDSKAKKILIIISFSVFIIFLGLLLLSLPDRKAEEKVFGNLKRIPGSADTTSIALANDSIYFSNGRAIVKYNSKTKQSEQISNTEVLPRIYNIIVSPGERYVLFKTGEDAYQYPIFDRLGAVHEQNPDIWWLLDTSTKTIKLISSNTPSISWLNSNEYTYGVGNQLVKGTVLDVSPKTIYTGKAPIEVVGLVGKKVVFNEQGVQLATTDEGGVVKKLSSSATRTILSSKEGCVFQSFSEDMSDDTVSKITGCSKKDISIKEPVVSGGFSDDGNIFYYYIGGEGEALRGEYVNLSTGRVGDWSISLPSSEDIQIIKVSSEAKATLRVGEYFYSSVISSPPLVGKNESLSIEDLVIDINKDDQSITVSKDTDYTEAERQHVLRLLRSKGFDINLVEVNFTKVTTDDYRWD